MRVREKGVSPNSEIFFHKPSETATQLFFYMLCCGNYYCTGSYNVKRQNYPSYLLLLVTKGKGYFYTNGHRHQLREGSLTLINCYEPHEYGTDSEWKILWCHFDGKEAALWYEKLRDQEMLTVQLTDTTTALLAMEQILTKSRSSRTAEAALNKYLVTLMTELLYQEQNEKEESKNFDSLLSYINNHLTENLSIQKMAEKACLSPYHFIRVFKTETGYTPHEYLILARINAAKFYLKTTHNSLKEITYECGFSSESSFSNTFKHICGLTPLGYRNKPNI